MDDHYCFKETLARLRPLLSRNLQFFFRAKCAKRRRPKDRYAAAIHPVSWPFWPPEHSLNVALCFSVRCARRGTDATTGQRAVWHSVSTAILAHSMPARLSVRYGHFGHSSLRKCTSSENELTTFPIEKSNWMRFTCDFRLIHIHFRWKPMHSAFSDKPTFAGHNCCHAYTQ